MRLRWQKLASGERRVTSGGFRHPDEGDPLPFAPATAGHCPQTISVSHMALADGKDRIRSADIRMETAC